MKLVKFVGFVGLVKLLKLVKLVKSGPIIAPAPPHSPPFFPLLRNTFFNQDSFPMGIDFKKKM